MSARTDAWATLRHGGNLLGPAALDSLPEPPVPRADTADRLRAALVGLPADGAAEGPAFAKLLDLVLEDAAGPRVGWLAGSALGASEAVKLLDGTAYKPRRLWRGPEDEKLAVFTTDAPRVGVGKGRRAVAHTLEYLRRRSIPLGVLTNGREWRFIWADADSVAWAEWDADRWLDADQLSPTFHLWRQLLSGPSLLREAGAAVSPLLRAIRDTRRGQAGLSKELGENVRRAVETLLRARRPVIEPIWSEHAASDLYVAACHVVMRLVVVLFAEARELLPVDNPVYNQAYGLRGLLDQLDRAPRERRRTRHSAWSRLLALFKLLHAGSPHPALSVLAYGGDLFRPGKDGDDAVARALAVLERADESPDDDTVHRILELLTRTKVRVREGTRLVGVAAPVDFSDLTSEYIGILYEGLLDYELHRAGEEPVVFLNLGDQPALPLERLEGMGDAAIAALVAKAKVKKQNASEEAEDDEAEGEDGDEADESADDAEEPDGAPSEGDAAEPAADLDDARQEALARAKRWAERAALAGKLVRKPRRGGGNDPTYRAAVEDAARQLVADVKLPGELFLVRWGGTRKGAGTFYTRPQLTLPTVRRTIRPLTHGAEDAPDFAVKTPEEILSLKVCDPAMGSGSFLVAALRVLTEAVEQAIWAHGRVVREEGRTRVDVETFAAEDRVYKSTPDDPQFAEWLRARVRRYVVEHCLYGVDLDPLAVELARVALWVETLDEKLPFTFLDHKLRCGNALIGTWFDRFRDYPLLAWNRKSPDEKWKGVHHAGDTWANALKERRDAVVREQAAVLSGQEAMPYAASSDEQLRKDIERVRALYRDLRKVSAARPDERARIWRERIQNDPAMVRVREAFDLWCALWFWPLDRLADAPTPRKFATPSDAARKVARDVWERVRFFHWELEFPDVFTAEGAGFDAVVGNPPWEIQKPNSKEFFSNHDPLYRSYGKQEALVWQKELFRQDARIEESWLAYLGDFKDRGNFVSYAAEPFGDGKVAEHDGGDVTLLRGEKGEALHKKWRSLRGRRKGYSDPAHPFRRQGSADLNTYKMFAEVAHAVARSGGQVGLILPSGEYLMDEQVFLSRRATSGSLRLLFKDIATAVHYRTMLCALTPNFPAVNAVPVLATGDEASDCVLQALLGSLALDFVARFKIGYLHLNYFVIEEFPLPRKTALRSHWDKLAKASLGLCGTHEVFAPAWLSLEADRGAGWRQRWAVTPHERLRLRAMLDAVVAVLYGLDRDDFAWILRDCDHPQAKLAEKAFCRTLDPKGFWRVDKDKPAELRHTVLSLVAFDALQACIAAVAGDRDKGIEAFCAQNDGDGWLLPETLRLADHGLGHDDRAQVPQPVASVLGPRFLDWQLAETPEESWAECERHARAILGDEEFERRFGNGAPSARPGTAPSAPVSVRPASVSAAPAPGEQAGLFPPKQQSLFPGGSK